MSATLFVFNQYLLALFLSKKSRNTVTSIAVDHITVKLIPVLLASFLLMEDLDIVGCLLLCIYLYNNCAF